MKIRTRKMIHFSSEIMIKINLASTQKLRTCKRYEQEESSSSSSIKWALFHSVQLYAHVHTYMKLQVDCDCENYLCGVAVVQDFFQIARD
mmetsp:Transcript_19779/g.30368  ORF Transcript_19779/g.30368 Transcript_19779/m.30368 type:complete len:90 (-) Transcript_19779:136-405(-)